MVYTNLKIKYFIKSSYSIQKLCIVYTQLNGVELNMVVNLVNKWLIVKSSSSIPKNTIDPLKLFFRLRSQQVDYTKKWPLISIFRQRSFRTVLLPKFPLISIVRQKSGQIRKIAVFYPTLLLTLSNTIKQLNKFCD